MGTGPVVMVTHHNAAIGERWLVENAQLRRPGVIRRLAAGDSAVSPSHAIAHRRKPVRVRGRLDIRHHVLVRERGRRCRPGLDCCLAHVVYLEGCVWNPPLGGCGACEGLGRCEGRGVGWV